MPEGRSPLRRLGRWLVSNLWPNQRLRWTREGVIYFFFWLGLLVTGLLQQINLILLVAGLAAGPMVGSIFVQRLDAPQVADLPAGGVVCVLGGACSRSTTPSTTIADGRRCSP